MIAFGQPRTRALASWAAQVVASATQDHSATRRVAPRVSRRIEAQSLPRERGGAHRVGAAPTSPREGEEEKKEEEEHENMRRSSRKGKRNELLRSEEDEEQNNIRREDNLREERGGEELRGEGLRGEEIILQDHLVMLTVR